LSVFSSILRLQVVFDDRLITNYHFVTQVFLMKNNKSA
jgi:hypothetical protein